VNQSRNIATYLLAASLFSLAGAIVYFSVQLANLSKDMPDLLSSIAKTSDKVEPVIKEVAQIRELIPPILKEVSATRKQIPAILQEVKQVREQIPPVLQEIREIRPLIPIVVEEVKNTREALPGLLTRSEKLVKEAGAAGQKASEGAVTGFFKGVITLPFKLIGGLGKTLFQFNDEVDKDLSEEDVAQLKKLGEEVFVLDEEGASRNWSNPAIGYTGKFSLKKIQVTDGKKCKTLELQLWKKGKRVWNKETRFCQNQDGSWTEQRE